MFGFGDEMIDITKAIGAVAATVAALGGSYTLADKFGWLDRAIIEWSPENFKIVAEAGIGRAQRHVLPRRVVDPQCVGLGHLPVLAPSVADAVCQVRKVFRRHVGDLVDRIGYVVHHPQLLHLGVERIGDVAAYLRRSSADRIDQTDLNR